MLRAHVSVTAAFCTYEVSVEVPSGTSDAEIERVAIARVLGEHGFRTRPSKLGALITFRKEVG